MDYELNLPFIGNITLWPYVAGAIVLLLIWDSLPALVAWTVKGIFSAIKSLISNVSTAMKNVPQSLPEAKPAENKGDVDASLQSLQALTVWAVHSASPEVLGRITALFADIQRHRKENE